MNAAARAVILLAAGLAIGGLLDARGLRKTAQTQPAGVGRDVALAVTRPLVDVSSFLRLDRPRRGIQDALGRSDVDRIDTTVRIPAPPPRPAPRPKPAVPAPTPTPAPAPKPKPKPVFTTARPLRVWVAGDSLAEVPGQALERATAERSPVRILPIESRLSTGLNRPDLYNWFDRIAAVPKALKPNVAVLSFGADDAHNYISGAPRGRTIGKLGSPSWNREYVRRASGVTRELNAAGVYVVWLGVPIPRGKSFYYSFRIVDRLLRQVVAASPARATYVDTWHMLATKKGRYADYLRDRDGKLVLMRAADGVHYTQAAGDLIAGKILRQLGAVYALRR